MPTDQLILQVSAERPIVRNDQTSDIDVAIDLVTSKSAAPQSTASYAINLCIVIDRSGSMAGDKLEQAKKSCVDIYKSLNPNDQLTVLAFDTEVLSVVNPQTPSNEIEERILELQSGGMTNLSKGWYLGLLELKTYATDEHIHRLVLLSDGQANEGEQKASVLGAESSRARDELDITTSTIGIGTDFQEDILAALAHESGGRFWFIGEARIEDIIKEEFSGALSIVLERPRIEVELPPGVTITQELNDLPKTSGRYRVRPIKGNDQFSFALRLQLDPTKVDGDKLPISAKLLDGVELVEHSETILSLGSAQDYVSSPEDPHVASVVGKYFAATSDEKMIEQMDEGNVTTMMEMLQAQSDLMKEVEAKLAGATVASSEAELQRQRRERELAELRAELQENQAFAAAGQLIDLMQGLGRADEASELLSHLRKMHMYREMRSYESAPRGDVDDLAAMNFLREAAYVADNLLDAFPDLGEELTAIRRDIDEQLARFS